MGPPGRTFRLVQLSVVVSRRREGKGEGLGVVAGSIYTREVSSRAIGAPFAVRVRSPSEEWHTRPSADLHNHMVPSNYVNRCLFPQLRH